jgi:hypothetical protein
MKRVMVRYRVRPDQAAANEGSIKEVFEQLAARHRPGCATPPLSSTTA